MTGLVSTTFPRREEEDDGPGPPARTWVDEDVAGEDWDEGCPGCGGRDPGCRRLPQQHPVRGLTRRTRRTQRRRGSP